MAWGDGTSTTSAPNQHSLQKINSLPICGICLTFVLSHANPQLSTADVAIVTKINAIAAEPKKKRIF